MKTFDTEKAKVFASKPINKERNKDKKHDK